MTVPLGRTIFKFSLKSQKSNYDIFHFAVSYHSDQQNDNNSTSEIRQIMRKRKKQKQKKLIVHNIK